MKIRPNDPLVVNFTFQSISDYPVDLYFLTDLSYTMSDDLETVSNMTNDIVLTMRNVTKKLQMGFGAFVDKPVFPFVVPTPQYLQNPCLNVGTKELHCDPPFLYKHILSLTDNFEEFREKTKVTRIAQVLTDKDISVIFAVDNKLHSLYTKLAAFLPSAAVGVLSASSTNIVDLLRDNYAKIANKAELMTTYESDYLEVSSSLSLSLLNSTALSACMYFDVFSSLY
ncbi:unnamed protein product [Echinostoma caproni]|uniref:Integrin beta n=1 Tax=Echinostoma caproni TaxID=27848 RepID=A0A3P8GWG7_9TREM|nr:unnamed protein product [Echinostoma caproni]